MLGSGCLNTAITYTVAPTDVQPCSEHVIITGGHSLSEVCLYKDLRSSWEIIIIRGEEVRGDSLIQ